MRFSIELPDEVVEEIARRAAELVLERTEQLAPAAPSADVSPWMTIPEAAAYLGCSVGRLYNLRCDGRLARHKDGRRALVARSEIVAMVETDRGLSRAERMRRVA